MKPGATTLPPASMVRLRGAAERLPMAAIFAVANADVSGIPRGAGAVDDVAVGDDDVEGVGVWAPRAQAKIDVSRNAQEDAVCVVRVSRQVDNL